MLRARSGPRNWLLPSLWFTPLSALRTGSQSSRLFPTRRFCRFPSHALRSSLWSSAQFSLCFFLALLPLFSVLFPVALLPSSSPRSLNSFAHSSGPLFSPPFPPSACSLHCVLRIAPWNPISFRLLFFLLVNCLSGQPLKVSRRRRCADASFRLPLA